MAQRNSLLNSGVALQLINRRAYSDAVRVDGHGPFLGAPALAAQLGLIHTWDVVEFMGALLGAAVGAYIA
jgi:hypothetical protein